MGRTSLVRLGFRGGRQKEATGDSGAFRQEDRSWETSKFTLSGVAGVGEPLCAKALGQEPFVLCEGLREAGWLKCGGQGTRQSGSASTPRGLIWAAALHVHIHLTVHIHALCPRNDTPAPTTPPLLRANSLPSVRFSLRHGSRHLCVIPTCLWDKLEGGWRVRGPGTGPRLAARNNTWEAELRAALGVAGGRLERTPRSLVLPEGRVELGAAGKHLLSRGSRPGPCGAPAQGWGGPDPIHSPVGKHRSTPFSRGTGATGVSRGQHCPGGRGQQASGL